MINISVKTSERTVIMDITDKIQQAVTHEGINMGLCYVFVPHTTAGITINENADPDVKIDMKNILNKLVPESSDYHHLEGNSDSHVKASLMGFSIMIAVRHGRLCLGRWQGIQFCEFDGPRTRQIEVTLIPSQLTSLSSS